jgi:zinc D-Ala-D-Ala dipeptidase
MRASPLLALCLFPQFTVAEALPPGFVRMSELAPEIASDIRYARTFNFTGGIVPGYEAPECIVTEETGHALVRAEAALNADGYGLILFDCYRPVQAVRHFSNWVKAEGRAPADEIFLPDLQRSDLIPLGYIAERSSHSLGVAVDVGLRRVSDPPMRAERAAGLRCDGLFETRPAESRLDMGTSFDCFSEASGDAAVLSDEAGQNRARLKEAMEAADFAGYAGEWWHFRFPDDNATGPWDFPVH